MSRDFLLRAAAALIAGSLALGVFSSKTASAVVLAEDEFEETSTEAGVVLRTFTFLLSGDILEPPYMLADENPVATSVFDARLYFQHKTPALKLVAANSLTLQLTSSATYSLFNLGQGVPPPRWLPLTFTLEQPDDAPTLTLQSNVDWLFAAYNFDKVTATLGRQPVTFGRGTIWHPSDVISAFSLTEVDTEYKPGVDAARVDVAFGDRTNLVLLGVIGRLETPAEIANDPDESRWNFDANLQGSAVLGQLRQGWESGEIGVMAGVVRYDRLLGIDAVANFDAVDVYAELVAHWLKDPGVDSLSAPGANGAEPVVKALVGAHWRPDPDITITPELYFNGFGSVHPADYLAIAQSERVSIGEQQGLGRWYGGVNAMWQVAPLTALNAMAISNLGDQSGLLSIGVGHNLAENVDFKIGGYIPMGTLPKVGDSLFPTIESEFGTYPSFFFAELKGTL
jgi:hypothetical protein